MSTTTEEDEPYVWYLEKSFTYKKAGVLPLLW